MADNKKEQERTELHRTTWGIANDLRGSVDGWDFNQYVLDMLFYHYISENLSTCMKRKTEQYFTRLVPNSEVAAIAAEIEGGRV